MKTTIRRSMTVIASAAALLLGAEASAAEGVIATQAYCGFEKKDGDIGGTLQLNGASIEGGTLKLTTLAPTDANTAYYKYPLALGAPKSSLPFHVYFSFSIKANGAASKTGAGLAFLAQNDGVGRVGANLDELGYGSIAPSLAIEFDTQLDANELALKGEHIGFVLNGEPHKHAASYLPQYDLDGFTSFISNNYSDKLDLRHVWIDYNGAEVLVYVSSAEDGKKPSKPIVWQTSPNAPVGPDNFDAATSIGGMNMGNPAAWLGFSASNYADGASIHSIHAWELSNEGIPCACQDEKSACPAALPACSKDAIKICVECTADNDSACTGKGEICDTDKEECGPCSKDADCNGHPNGNRCALTGSKAGQCVECVIDEHCPSRTPICDQTTNTCIECDEDTQCPNEEPVCNTKIHACEICDTDEDCSGRSSTPVCATSGQKKGQCVPKGCEDCPEGTTCNVDSCVPNLTIEGGGLACAASSGSGAPTEGPGTLAGIMGALGVAAAVARRRRRTGKGA